MLGTLKQVIESCNRIVTEIDERFRQMPRSQNHHVKNLKINI